MKQILALITSKMDQQAKFDQELHFDFAVKAPQKAVKLSI